MNREKEEMNKMYRFESGMNDKLQKALAEMNAHWEERMHNGANTVHDNAGPNLGDGDG